MNRDENVYVLSPFALSERLSRTAIILVEKTREGSKGRATKGTMGVYASIGIKVIS